MAELKDFSAKHSNDVKISDTDKDTHIDGIPEDCSQEMLTLAQVDQSPSPKERSKTLSKITTHMFMLLHNLKWVQFDNYIAYLTKRFPSNPDIEIVCSIYRLDNLRNNRNHSQAFELFARIESLLKKSMSESLCVRYLTCKAFTMYILGDQQQALSLQAQAVQLGALQTPCDATAYNMMVYGLQSCLHRVDDSGNSIIPSDQSWRRAESFYYMACRQHMVWTRDLEDASKIPERYCQSFFLFAFIRYMFSLVRSCVAGGFVHFEEHRCPAENLDKVIGCIERVKQQEELLSTKMRFEFLLVQCDYFLRLAERQSKNRQMFYRKSQQILREGLSCLENLHNLKHASTCRTYANIRLQFIEHKLLDRPRNDHTTREFTHKNAYTTRMTKLGIVSHMEPFRAPSSPRTEVPPCTFLYDLGHRPSHFGRGSEIHVAECPECALTQTTPKESNAFELDLNECAEEIILARITQNERIGHMAPSPVDDDSHDVVQDVNKKHCSAESKLNFSLMLDPGSAPEDVHLHRTYDTRPVAGTTSMSLKGPMVNVCGVDLTAHIDQCGPELLSNVEHAAVGLGGDSAPNNPHILADTAGNDTCHLTAGQCEAEVMILKRC